MLGKNENEVIVDMDLKSLCDLIGFCTRLGLEDLPVVEDYLYYDDEFKVFLIDGTVYRFRIIKR